MATTTTQNALPKLSIADPSPRKEGNSGVVKIDLSVVLSAPSSKTVTVQYSTIAGTASADMDYVDTSGSLTFPPGTTSQTLSIPVLGDTQAEADETFKVSLSQPLNATLSDSSATVTLLNDDLPVLSITGTSIAEGNSGSSKATVKVSLSAASMQTVTVKYATTNGTATENSDYVGAGGTLSFAPGETSKSFTVPIVGDKTVEADETVKLSLSSPSNATLGTASATLTIKNDDSSSSSAQVKSVIDLGPNYGKLIAPVNVDGHLYYYWDRSGDGTKENIKGAGYNNTVDRIDHDTLDRLFIEDINGQTGSNGNTDNTYRYATINGVHVALPTCGNGSDTINSAYYTSGTTVGGSPTSSGSTAINSTYDDLLAIWDAYNGVGTGTKSNGTPPDWLDNTYYWSATPSTTGHTIVQISGGFVALGKDSYTDYVALEVL